MQKKLLLSMALSTLLLQATESKTLENRVDKLEKALASQQKAKLAKALNGSNSFNQKSFIPDISLILNASAVSRNIKNSDYEGYGIDGFVDHTDEIPFNKNRGFNLNYAEFGMHSEVGPYFDADAIFHLHPDEFEIEEAYITTKKLPANMQLKAGLFRSSFGRINAIHQHAQAFVAQPLVYEAMLGVEGIKDAGVSLNWVAPTDTYLMVGAEALQGSNELSFGYPESNNLYVGYLKTGFDIGDSNALLMGGSVASGKTEEHQNSRLYGAELTLKHTIDSYSSISWQSEYLYRDKNKQKQAGLYSQLRYNMDSSWEFGGRYDALIKNLDNQPDDLKKYSAIVSYRPFEFSKIRLQYSKDRSKSFVGKRQDEDMIALDFLVEIGAHGAHAF
jgi:hypothetical protein